MSKDGSAMFSAATTMFARCLPSMKRHVAATNDTCTDLTLPGASPRALLLGSSYSSGLVTCGCLAPARHGGLSRFVSYGLVL
jgi:hypothetical protein